jgi:DNA-binding response OmpR family regulator
MHILVADDEERILSVIKEGLESERHVVDIACDGAEALDKALGSVYQVIILDWTMPLQSGPEVCQILRREGCATPILLLTVKNTLEDKIAGLDAGADDYLTKPFALGELAARVRALGRRATGVPPEQVLSYSDIRMDLVTHEVSRGSHKIELTPKEFALLECFLRHSRQVLSRTQITDQVWGYDFDSFSNVVDVYIRYLRNKLEFSDSSPIIHTMRGAGYRLWDEKFEQRKLQRE